MSGLSVVDYIIFAVVLCLSAAIGIYFAVAGKGQKTDGEYLMASRSMGFFPVTLSLLASLLSAISLLGAPAEIYLYGTQYYFVAIIAFIAMTVLMAHVVIPVVYPLKLTSIFEYLEMRFHPLVRVVATFVYVIHNLIYVGIVMYAPALALDAVTGISWQWCVIAIGIICTIYTTVGGLKAVLYTDSFQLCIMVAGLIGIIIKSSYHFDGMGEVFRRMSEGGRVEFFNLDPSPMVRTTLWSGTFGLFLVFLYGSGLSQPFQQRYFSCRTMRVAKISAWSNCVGFILITGLCTLAGSCTYAYYMGCDPLATGRADKPDQILALLVMDLMTEVKGFAGLFVSCIFCACLSTLSSFLNSLAAIVVRDLIHPIKKLISSDSNNDQKELGDDSESKSSKITAAVFGVIAMGMAFLASVLGDILQVAFSLNLVESATMAIFLMGFLLPFVNWKGALVGMIAGQIVGVWLAAGSFISGKASDSWYPLSTANCTYNFTTDYNMTMTDVTTEMTKSDSGTSLYQMSYYCLGIFSFVTTVVVTCVVSLATGRQDKTTLRNDCVYQRVRTFDTNLPDREKGIEL